MGSIQAALKKTGISLLISLCVAFSAVAAEFDQQKEFSIPAQALTSALLKFAEQSKIQILTSSQDLSGYKTQGVKGRHTARSALQAILSGTDLTFREVGKGTITVARQNAPASATTEATPVSLPMRLVQAGPQESTTNSRTPARSQTEETSASQEGDEGVPEMLVKDARISNTDIKRTEDDPQPYVVFGREEIERSMASSLEDFLKTRLPMNAVQQTNSQYPGLRFGNTSKIDLRGLGTNQTLVLVNGRHQPRIIDGFGFGEYNQPDINGIPLAAIERIEVLPSTASGIYGGGATGGVINIILKRSYTGGEMTVGYKNTFATHAGERRVDGNLGFSLEGGRTSVMASGSYSDAAPLRVRDRNFATRGRELLQKNYPAGIYSPTFVPPYGATPNFKSASGNLVLLDGRPLNSTVTYSPYGYRGVSSDDGAALLANAGRLNFDMPEGAGGLDQSIINDPQTLAGSLTLRRDFGGGVEAFIDLSLNRNVGYSSIELVEGYVTLFPGDPLNPFDNIVDVLFPVPGLESRFRTFNETRQGTAGVIWRLPGQWVLNGEYTWSRSGFEYGYDALNNAGELAFVDGTIDFTRDPMAHPLDYSPYFDTHRDSVWGPQYNFLKTPSLRLAGPVARLPGGALNLTTQVQVRDESSPGGFANFFGEGDDLLGTLYSPPRSQEVRSAYVEMRAPLVSGKNARPWVQDLEVQLSSRHDRYMTDTVISSAVPLPGSGVIPAVVRATNRVDSTDYTLGLRYSPVRDLAFRASYGTGFLPPSLGQVFPRLLPSTFIRGNDPKRGGGSFVYTARVTTGGNPALTPEVSRSWSAGAIYTPSALAGWRLSLDFTRIRKTDEISSLSVQNILDNEALLASRITRAALTAPDQALGYTGGRITAVDTTLANLSNTALEAFDLQLDYTRDTAGFGQLKFYLIGTHQNYLRRQVLPTSPVLDTVGFSGGVLQLRGNGGLSWEHSNWTLGWNTQYFHHYKVYGAGSLPVFRNEIVAWQGSDTIPHQIYHDLFGRYRFEGERRGWAGIFSGVELTASIQNVFDTSPPLLATTESVGGYSYYGDPRMRRYALSLRKSF